MTSRKKNILFIQLIIFLVASILFYNTYRDKNKKEIKNSVKIEAETSPDTNSFVDIEYSGFDLSGNRYLLNAKYADFGTETPELINMKEVIAKFYLKDESVLTVTSDEGLYNNITLDMDFRNNVKSDYTTHLLFSDLLSYSNTNSKHKSSLYYI